MRVLYHAEQIAEGIGDGGHADAPTNVLYLATSSEPYRSL
jgi:hypothetical protein